VKPVVILKRAVQSVRFFFKNLSEAGVFWIWLGLLLIVSALIWALSAPARSGALARAANAALAEQGDRRRLKAPLSQFGLYGPALQAGSWFITDENSLAVVWSMPRDGIFAPYLTLFSNEMNTDKIIPLSETAVFALNNSPEGVFELSARRVELAARQIQAARGEYD
jgi:hypothetical protein